MKWVGISFIALIILCSCVEHARLAKHIATEAPLIGRGSQNECWRFALDLSCQLNSRRIPCWVVVYDWSSGLVTGRHAIAVYDDGRGYWAMDNLSESPRHLISSNAVAWAREYSHAHTIWFVGVYDAKEVRKVYP